MVRKKSTGERIEEVKAKLAQLEKQQQEENTQKKLQFVEQLMKELNVTEIDELVPAFTKTYRKIQGVGD